MSNEPNTYRALLSEKDYNKLLASCKWVMGRYCWAELQDYLIDHENGRYSIEINYEEAWELWEACEADNDFIYPCASDWVTEHLDNIFQHYGFLQED